MKIGKKMEKDFNQKGLTIILTLIVFGLFLSVNCKKSNNQNSNVNSDTIQNSESKSEKFSDLKNGIDEKFKKSSNAILKSIDEDKGSLTILLEKDGYGSDGDLYIVAIDVAISINRLKTPLDFKSIKIIGEKEEFTFTKEIYEKYKSGQINDSQFKSLSKSTKRK